MNWSLPHTLGQPHKEVDKLGKTCTAYDLCISSNTFELTHTDERVKQMVCETAIEAINRAYSADLDMKFTLPKKVFMGPKEGPGVQALRPKDGEEGGAGGADGAGGAGTGALSAAEAAITGGRLKPLSGNAPSNGSSTGTAAAAEDANAKSSAFAFDKAVKRPAAKAKVEKEPDEECEPKHSVVHRDATVDLTKSFGTGSASTQMEARRDNRPAELVVRVDTPKIGRVTHKLLTTSPTTI